MRSMPFYQLLHQGTEAITCDFIAPTLRYHAKEVQHIRAAKELQAQHQLALANCLAQSRLLALGEAALRQTNPSSSIDEVTAEKSKAEYLFICTQTLCWKSA